MGRLTGNRGEQYGADGSAFTLILITGGSDFHGRIKPNIELGTVDWLEYEIPVRNALLQALGQHDL